ncbi:MAG TPA: thiamine biosynthesis protein ThiS [Phycisphaerales bacterium]|nr:MAG: thiamine biosynthesis protein ThiS [Planctomycetes bacterium GWC2_45_44]HBG77992.1 thiamine biosynthesis protein ThiS [Phycisphaerales bacterium]
MTVLRINGEDKHFENSLPATLADLLDIMKVDAATVVAEIDGQIIKKNDFSSAKLSAGQKIELIRLVGGG